MNKLKLFEEFVTEARINSPEFNEGLAFLRTVDYEMNEDGAQILVDTEDLDKLKNAISVVFG